MNKPNYFKLEITTPERTIFSGDVIQVKAPGKFGSFGVLVNHTPALFLLTVGHVDVLAVGGNRLFTVSGGYAKVQNNTMKIISQAAEDAQILDIERAREALKQAKLAITQKMPKIEYKRADAKLARATNRISAAQKLGRA